MIFKVPSKPFHEKGKAGIVVLDCVPFLPPSLRNANDGCVTGLTEVSPSGQRSSPLKGLP